MLSLSQIPAITIFTHVHFGWVRFLKYALLSTLIAVAVCQLMLIWRYA